ncbi:MAG: phosphate ABC transporter permease PstA [Bacillati bacterium ANGP1]|uniref:Phosphate transport system permease protein PstA n=1 Tax=Candidatus Segetimicrobium genomatis TaxID=2569760 RepID=A0A537JIC4_9BACT|nr:MAG: phosphate ABC transporter permease PstA [Terrabacteria group bacterium ANGP1]
MTPTPRAALRRRLVDRAMTGLSFAAVLLALVPLASVLGYVVAQGITALNWAFFTQLPRPVGETGGGMANAIAGTLTLIGLASCIGLPVGILGGVYLGELGNGRLGGWIRFTADVLNGVPSIVVGIFVYTLLVVPMKRFSALAGGAALGIMMTPLVMRTTEELVRLVPATLREAALALGVPWRVTTLRVVLRTATVGVVTGVMLAVARISGETAPLLFTAFNNQYWQSRLDQPTASLTVQLYNYAIAPYDDWHRQAWAAALVLMTMVLVLNITARLVGRRQVSARRSS